MPDDSYLNSSEMIELHFIEKGEGGEEIFQSSV